MVVVGGVDLDYLFHTKKQIAREFVWQFFSHSSSARLSSIYKINLLRKLIRRDSVNLFQSIDYIF